MRHRAKRGGMGLICLKYFNVAISMGLLKQFKLMLMAAKCEYEAYCILNTDGISTLKRLNFTTKLAQGILWISNVRRSCP